MTKSWVANNGSTPKQIGGQWVLPGSGVLVDDPDPGASVPLSAHVVAVPGGQRQVIVDGVAYGLIPAAQAQALVSGAGNPTDLLTGPLQRVTITGALSTTATQAAAATGTYYKARVAWNNNGASGSAKLRIAVNCDNDVHGLMVGQNVKRRDHELTMGDAVMLVCGVPITRLTFSADGSITGGTHQLQVTFGN